MLKAGELSVTRLGESHFPSPLRRSQERFVVGDPRVLVSTDPDKLRAAHEAGEAPPSFERAGPRGEIYFDSSSLACGIVTCGGLCPGLNDVIRSVVMTLSYGYGVRRILGFRYGFQGLTTTHDAEPVGLTPEIVDDIHQDGGTILGSSRGPQEVAEMVATLERCKIGILFCIGGDGTLAGASAIAAEVARRGLEIAVVAIPKTIDNDIVWVERSFGFATAVEEARRAIQAAHVEAKGAWNGVGLVKLMGRHSGFITAHACLADNDANYCLIPEVPFTLEGEGGFLETLETRLREKHHAVIVVAEGAGQELMGGSDGTCDASGNPRLQDIGRFLHEEVIGHFEARGLECTAKYIDPSYMIRSLPANSMDSEFCLILGQHAVHAGMAGKTDLVIGYWNQCFTHLPIRAVVGRRKRIELGGSIWPRVLEATGQPF